MSLTRRTCVAALAALSAATLAGCGGASKEATSVAAATAPATAAAPDAPLNKKIAYLSASTANTFLAASKKEMDKVAAANGVQITTFDAQFKPGEQSKQIQDVIASHKYDGIVIASIDGAAIIPDLQKAKAAGLEIGLLNQVVGTRLDTADLQFAGPAVSVIAPPYNSGLKYGDVTLKACQGLSPCRVVYFYGLKGTPLDVALRRGFDKTTAGKDVKVVAEAEGKYLGPDVALKATQDLLQRTKDFDVVVGPDQAIQGVQIALRDAGRLDKVKLIGLGGSSVALKSIKAGTWYGEVMSAPGGEGRLLMEGMVKKFRTGQDTGGTDATSKLPDGGRVDPSNVDKFTAEWDG